MLQPLDRRGVECVIHHEQDVCSKNSAYIYVPRISNNRVSLERDLHCVACCHSVKLAVLAFRSQQRFVRQ